jgi:hypothetical protein
VAVSNFPAIKTAIERPAGKIITLLFKIDSEPEPLFKERLTVAGHLDKTGNQYPSTSMPV